MRWFMPFLASIFLGEVVGVFSDYNQGPFKLSGFYCSYFCYIVQVLFYGYIFSHFISNTKIKKAILAMTIIITIAYIFSFFLLDKAKIDMFYFSTITIFFQFCLTLIALIYLYQLFSSDHETRLIYHPGFWIAFGVTIFSSGFNLVLCFYPSIIKLQLNIWGQPLYRIVPRLLCAILYPSLSIAIWLSRKERCRAISKHERET